MIEKKHQKAVTCISVSNDGTKVASGDAYRYVYIFDTAERKDIGCQAYHQAKVLGVAFSQDGERVATIGNDLTIGVIDVAAKKKTVLKNAT